MASNSRPVEHILDDLRDAGEDNDDVSIGMVVSAIGDRGWGPFLFVPALIALSPLSGVPGVPSFLALLIMLFAVQMVLGRDSVWLPGFLERRSVKGEKLSRAMRKMRPVGERLDRWFHGRLPALTSGTARRAAAIATLLLCLTVPPLELVPFAGALPMGAIAVFGLALLLRDGLLMIAGFVPAIAAAVAVVLGI